MIAAIDPGSEKTGTAILQEDGTLVEKKIVPTKQLVSYLQQAYEKRAFHHIVMGNGTNHKHLQPCVEAWIREGNKPITFSLIDERYTTVEGRKLYFKYTPRKGWRRLVPLALQYPPEPVDDFGAWIIGLRYIRAKGGKTC